MLQVPDADRRYALRSARVCSSGGEPLPKAIYERWLERFGLEILDGIGSTEMCHTFIANRRGHLRPGSSGTVLPGYEAKLRSEEHTSELQSRLHIGCRLLLAKKKATLYNQPVHHRE